MKDCSRISKLARKFLALFSLSLGCFLGCWQEIKYEPGERKVQPQSSLVVNEQAPPEQATQEPSGVSRRADPLAEPATELPEEPQPESSHEPITAEHQQPKSMEPEPDESINPEPEAAPAQEPESQVNPIANAGRLSELEPHAESSLVQPDVVETTREESTAPSEVTEPVSPSEPTEQLFTSASEPAEAVSDAADIRAAESNRMETVSSDSETEAEDDDPFSLFDSREPETEKTRTEQREESAETKLSEKNEQPQPKKILDVHEEIDLLFGEKPVAPRPSETKPAPPLPAVSPDESEGNGKAATEAKYLIDPALTDEDSDKEAPADSSDQAAPEVETQAPESQPELPEPQAEKKDISILVQPKKSVDRANVWRAASRWSLALALHAKGMKPKSYQSAWKSAETAAETLTLKLPLIPKIGEDQDPVATVQVAMIEAEGPDLWQAIEQEHGIPAGDLAELAVRTHRMLLTYSPTKPHFANEAVELTRLAESAELPSSLWQPLVKLMEAQGPYKEVKRAIFQMHKNVAQHYSAK